MRGPFIAGFTFLAVLLAGCGGGGSNIVPPPPTGGFSNTSLKGQYAFLMSGEDLSGAYLARVGSFTADGSGNITGGLEDVLDLGTGNPAALVSFTGGSYQVQENGRALIVLHAAAGGELQLNMVMQTTSAGFLVETDLNAASSGTFSIQTSASFSQSAVTGPYVFELSGFSFSGKNVAPISIIGNISANGNGSVTGGVMDTNDGNLSAPSGATPVAPGTYSLDNVNGATVGRGMMAFNGRSYIFYIVDSAHMVLLENDALGGSSGDVLGQSASIPTQNSEFTGSFTYLVGGAAVTGSQGALARVARYAADGNGGIGAISLDQNYNGSYLHISQGSNISAATYSIDTSYPGSGRGIFTFSSSGNGKISGVFYLFSSAQGVVQDTSPGIIGTGPFYAQTGGPFSLSSSVGNYVSNWSGVQLGSSTAVPFEEDFVGQYAVTNVTSNNIAGVSDYVEMGLSSNTLFSNVGLGGTLTINGDGTANNLYKFVLAGSPSVTVNFQAYYANPGTVLLVCSDNTRTTAGIIKQQ